MKNNRVLFIEIETVERGKRELKRLDGLALRVKVSRKRGAVLSNAFVSIANLTRSDVEYLTTYLSPYINPSIRKKINIYAGYEQTGYGRIFTGDIYKAIPSDIPDVWLNIEAKSLFYQNRVPISYCAENISMKEAAQSISTTLELPLDYQASTNKIIDIFNFKGSKAELIKKYNSFGDIVAFEDNGRFKVQDKINTKKPTGNIKLISKESGMIGMPEPDQFGVKVKTLCDPSAACGDWVQIKSDRIPSINGQYQTYTLDFDLTNREEAFYSIFYGKRYGIY